MYVPSKDVKDISDHGEILLGKELGILPHPEEQSYGEIWRNGRLTTIGELVGRPEQSWKGVGYGKDGVMVANTVNDNGVSQAVVLLPVFFDVFPEEATAQAIEEAGEDDWEVEVHQISTDDPWFWVQASVSVGRLGPDGEFGFYPVEDGSEVEWNITSDSAPGASLSAPITTTEAGLATVRLDMPPVPKAKWKVEAKLKNYIYRKDETSPPQTIQAGGLKVRTQFFQMLPGLCDSVDIEVDGTTANVTLPADGHSEVLLTATLKDAVGAPVARGTDVTWWLTGAGRLRDRGIVVAGEDGVVTARLVAGSVPGTQTVTVTADAKTATFKVTNTPVTLPPLSFTPASADIATQSTVQVTVDAADHPDGTPVFWNTSKGSFSTKGSVVSGGQATAVLVASSGTIGEALVSASIGDATAHCRVPFVSSAPISIKVTHPVIVSDATVDGSLPVPTLKGPAESINFHTTATVEVNAPTLAGQLVPIELISSGTTAEFRFPLDTASGGNTYDTSHTVAAALNGAAVTNDTDAIWQGSGSLSMQGPTSTAAITARPWLVGTNGFNVSLNCYIKELAAGTILSRANDYKLEILGDGRIKWTLYTSPATSLTSSQPVTVGRWFALAARIENNALWLNVDGAQLAAPILAAHTPTATQALTIGGYAGYMDDLSFVATSVNTIPAVASSGLDSSGRLQLNSSGKGTFTLAAAPSALDTPAGGKQPIARSVTVKADTGAGKVTAKDAVTVAPKAKWVLIKAIAGRASGFGGVGVTDADRDEYASALLNTARSTGQHIKAIPSHLGGNAADRALAGYRIGLWMEETVDPDGKVHTWFRLISDGLDEVLLDPDDPTGPTVANILNMMVADVILEGSDRNARDIDLITWFFSEAAGKSRGTKAYQLMECLKILSTGDLDTFMNIAMLTSGLQGFEALAQTSAKTSGEAVAGVVKWLVQSASDAVGEVYHGARTFIDETRDVTGWEFSLQSKPAETLLKRLGEGIAGTEDGLRSMSEYLVNDNVMPAEGAYVFGLVFGVISSASENGSQLLKPEEIKEMLGALAQLCTNAALGEGQAREVLRSLPQQLLDSAEKLASQTRTLWDQGQFFAAGKASGPTVVAAITGGAAASKSLAAATTRMTELFRLGKRGWAKRFKFKGHSWRQIVGNVGEGLIKTRILKSKRFSNPVSFQNPSGHGIDLICQDKSGRLVIIEVKAHLEHGNGPRLSSAQQLGGHEYAINRLNEGLDKNWWKGAERARAKNYRDKLLKNATAPSAFVVDIPFVLSVRPSMKWYEWKRGSLIETVTPL